MSQHRDRVGVESEAAWADWPDTLRSTASAVVFHLCRDERTRALELLDGMLADLQYRQAVVAGLVVPIVPQQRSQHDLHRPDTSSA